jgi:hypothetical protein
MNAEDQLYPDQFGYTGPKITGKYLRGNPEADL